MAERKVLLATEVKAVGGIDRVLQSWKYGWLTEKLDGLRAVVKRVRQPDGSLALGVYSSQMNQFTPTKEWLDQVDLFLLTVEVMLGLPPGMVALDGELWMGYGTFQTTSSVVRSWKDGPKEAWQDVEYRVFDIISTKTNGNIGLVNTVFETVGIEGTVVRPLIHQIVRDTDDVERQFERIVGAGGEGVIVRSPSCLWVPKRSRDIVKIKPELDAEAVVVGYTGGEGRLVGMLGSLVCRDGADGAGVQFGLAGLTDRERGIGWEDRFPIGSVVTYRYGDRSDDGVPKFPRYYRMVSVS